MSENNTLTQDKYIILFFLSIIASHKKYVLNFNYDANHLINSMQIYEGHFESLVSELKLKKQGNTQTKNVFFSEKSLNFYGLVLSCA